MKLFICFWSKQDLPHLLAAMDFSTAEQAAPKQPARALGVHMHPVTQSPFCLLTKEVALTAAVMPEMR